MIYIETPYLDNKHMFKLQYVCIIRSTLYFKVKLQSNSLIIISTPQIYTWQRVFVKSIIFSYLLYLILENISSFYCIIISVKRTFNKNQIPQQ